MKEWLAFFRKEWMAQVRGGKFLALTLTFVGLGFMNPLIASLTPVLIDLLQDALAESGMAVASVSVDAMASWAQFFKNISMGLIVFVVIESNILTQECSRGTLVMTLTKGMPRHKVMTAKALTLSLFFTALYWLSFAITYVYNAIAWDNAVAKHLLFSAALWWLLGLWAIALLFLFSAVAPSNLLVLSGTGGAFLLVYLIGLLPKVGRFVPAYLMNPASLLTGVAGVGEFFPAVIVTCVLCAFCFVASIPLFYKKQI